MQTLKAKVERLIKMGVLKKVNRCEWAAPTFVVPKKDGSARCISDFRERNERTLRKPHPIPNVQDTLLNLAEFQWAASLDLNMGCCHICLNRASKQLCTFALPFGKHECQAIPMGLCNGPDNFQEKMSELMDGLAFVCMHIDDLLCLTRGTFSDHLEKLKLVLRRLQRAGLKVFAIGTLRVLDCPQWNQTRTAHDKVKAIMKIAEPENQKEL